MHLNHTDSGGGAARAAFRIHQSLLSAGVSSEMHVARPALGDPTIRVWGGTFANTLGRLRPHLGRLPGRLLQTGNPNGHSPSVLPSAWPRRTNQSDADIVQLHWVCAEMLSVEDIGRIAKPVVWTLMDMWAFCGAEHLTEDLRYRDGYSRANRPSHESGFDLNRWTWNRKRRAWRKPMHIVAPSQWMADCAAQSALMGDWPVSVIPLPLPTDFWCPVDRLFARDLLGLPGEGPLLAFGAMGGGRHRLKGIDLLFDALAHLRGQIPGLQLVVFGERRPLAVPDVGFPVHYTGHLNDDLSLKALYSAADAVVVPSRQEAFGQTASEALACGTPVIAFDACGPRDIVRHQETGWLATPFDTIDLARGIQWVLDDQTRLQILGANARRDAELRFGERHVAEQYIRLYEQILA